MNSDSCNRFDPQRLKTLASNVEYTNGNNLIHQFVLDNSIPNTSGSENYINAALMSMSEVPVNALNDNGYSALHLAVQKNNLLMVKKLLSCLVNIDVNRGRRYFNSTALHLAAKFGRLSIVQELLNKEASIHILDYFGNTALDFAAKSGNLDIVKLLVSKGGYLKVGSALHRAVESGNLAVVKFLVSHVEWIGIGNGFDDNLCCALISDKSDIARLLGTCMHVDFRTVNARQLLISLSLPGNSETRRILTDKLVDMNVKCNYSTPPMTPWVNLSKLATVKYLVSLKANIDARDGFNETPLHYAAHLGSLEILEYLISEYADVNAKDGYNKTALHYAVVADKLENVECLVREGADVNATDQYYDTPLHYAACNDNLEIVEYLVGKGSDVHVKNRNNETPLQRAVRRNNLKVVEFLTRKSNDLNENVVWRFPLNYAVYKTI